MSLSERAEICRLKRALADAEERARKEEKLRHQAEGLNRSTTLCEYLELCHTHLSARLAVETNPNLTTCGSISAPTGKKRPSYYRPWSNFPSLQKSTLNHLFEIYPPASQAPYFNSRIGMEELGKDTCRRALGSEKDIEVVAMPMVVIPVSKIMEHLAQLPPVCQAFGLQEDLWFTNHLNPLSAAKPINKPPGAGGPAAGRRGRRRGRRGNSAANPAAGTQPSASRGAPSPMTLEKKPRSGRPDLVCIYSSSLPRSHPDATAPVRKLALVMELKPPHKLPVTDLRRGFHPTNIRVDVLETDTIPTDTVGHGQYLADKHVASVVTQAFSYMIEGGVEYGVIATGAAFAFLHIELHNPSVVYYHLIEPNVDVDAKKAAGEDHIHHTAVSQVLAFTLLALKSAHDRRANAGTDADTQQRLRETSAKLPVWEPMPHAEESSSAVESSEDASEYENTPSTSSQPNTTSSPSTSSTPSPPSPPSTLSKRQYMGSPPGSSTIASRAKRRHSCKPHPEGRGSEGSPEPPDDEDARRDVGSPFAARGGTGGGSVGAGAPEGSGGGQWRERPYCTPDCLRGLACSGFLDAQCPNFGLHSATLASHHNPSTLLPHPLTRKQFLALLQTQLAHSLDRHVYPLGTQGACGVIFKITLASHGYTLVAKATTAALLPDLVHESRMYARLKPLQGNVVPVCLGTVTLKEHPYYYDVGVQLVHMLLLSWGGRPLPGHIREAIAGDQWWEHDGVKLAVDAVRECGVVHEDVRAPNLLWDEIGLKVVVIDFERARGVEKTVGSGKRAREADITIRSGKRARREASHKAPVVPPTHCQRKRNRQDCIIPSSCAGGRRTAAARVQGTEGSLVYWPVF
ncbi:hypothetical protein FGG08_004607 [Glutinoglossum americanum]|uniref:Protein kinase domain-containing protein n=1 Tax=Glutinoglossum americanum TaxID=1670608 RepID=A0A9P8L2C2_9PEZI|nr:hypothetical protein FGG08_004607 [Glutinoglossum americanum]